MTAGVHMSHGRWFLRTCLARRMGLGAVLARRLRVSKGTISDLASGRCAPSREVAIGLERELGIAPCAWDLIEFGPSNLESAKLGSEGDNDNA